MDTNEFIHIINQHKGIIYKISNAYVSNEESKKDLEQEILIQIWLSLKRFNGKVKVSTWIYKVAINTAINFLKKDTKHQKTHSYNDAIIFTIPNEDPIDNENIKILYKALNQLKPIDKALILLYFDKYSQKEISEIIGVSTSNVSTRINRIKQKISKIILKSK